MISPNAWGGWLRRLRPRLSVIVVAYRIPEQLRRTLQSLSSDYQRDIHPDDYEVIVVDNGGQQHAVDAAMVRSMRGNFRLLRVAKPKPSPADAVNRGIRAARGRVVGVMVDGARLVSPGLLHAALVAADAYPRTVVTTTGWYLGHDWQARAMGDGYTPEEEARLLASIDWPSDGYRLFEISTEDESSSLGWAQPVAESNALFMRRDMWQELGGFDERFESPGGGFVNLDTYRRACSMPGITQVTLLGEATFHQLHGGVATNAPLDDRPRRLEEWAAEYEAIRGERFQGVNIRPRYFGHLPPSASLRFARSLVLREKDVDICLFRSGAEAGVQRDFDEGVDAAAREVLGMAQHAFSIGLCATTQQLCRWVLERAPRHPEANRLLSLTSHDIVHLPYAAQHEVMLGRALQALGRPDDAVAHFQRALELNPGYTDAYWELAKLRMGGGDYRDWLSHLHLRCKPRVYLEIGVFTGNSLALAEAPTIAVGIDPEPRLSIAPRAPAHIAPETSDAFFARPQPSAFWGGAPVDLAFIDGLHRFTQILRDFANVERCCARDGVIVLHDTVPFDEATSGPERVHEFHTGDSWKMLPLLRELRPDLEVMTIPTPPSGLTIVSGLDPTFDWTTVLRDQALVDRFDALTYGWLMEKRDETLRLVGTDLDEVWARIERGRAARRELAGAASE